jgi:N-acetylglutamate synthase-like GNAT family acetyltransferase
MTIRKGTKQDVNTIIRMVQNFQEQMNMPISLQQQLDTTYLNKLYYHIILGGGLALIAEKDDKVVGMMLGVKNSNIWFPDQVSLQEIMIWVEPEYRTGRIGYNLIKEFNRIADEMKNKKEISRYTISVTQDFGKLNYSKLGYSKTEEIWSVGV